MTEQIQHLSERVKRLEQNMQAMHQQVFDLEATTASINAMHHPTPSVPKLGLGYALLDPLTLTIRNCNAAFAVWAEQSQESLIGEPFASYFPEIIGSEGALRTSLDNEQSLYIPTVHSKSGGQIERHYDLHFEPAPEFDHALIAIITDRTMSIKKEQRIQQERNELRLDVAHLRRELEAAQLYRQIVEEQDQLICRYRTNGTIIVANRAYCNFFGRSPRTIQGKFFYHEVAEDEPQLLEHVKQSLLSDEADLFEHQVVMPDGNLRWLQWTSRGTFSEAGELLEIQSVGLDITETRHTELLFNQYAQDLHSRNTELDSFAHTVAHDLKNPLGVITSYGDLLRQMASIKGFELSQDVQNYLRGIDQTANQMISIINELLLLASVRGEVVALDSFDMGDVVQNAYHRLVWMVQDHKGEVKIATDWPKALGHAPWVEEVWCNYLSNAIKYGGYPPKIELGYNRLDDEQVRFWIKDNGDGLSEEERARLFTPFTQIKQAKTEGHGLGLSIVRRIVEKLNGNVGVESTVGAGSLFYFVLFSPKDD